jgi:hypothetical protein
MEQGPSEDSSTVSCILDLKVHKNPYPVPILSHMKLFHAPKPYFPKIHLNILSLLCLGLPSCLPLRIPNMNICKHFSPPSPICDTLLGNYEWVPQVAKEIHAYFEIRRFVTWSLFWAKNRNFYRPDDGGSTHLWAISMRLHGAVSKKAVIFIFAAVTIWCSNSVHISTRYLFKIGLNITFYKRMFPKMDFSLQVSGLEYCMCSSSLACHMSRQLYPPRML